jgi:hypothetical protein
MGHTGELLLTPAELVVQAAFHDDDDVAALAMETLLDVHGGDAGLAGWLLGGEQQRLLPALGQRTQLIGGLEHVPEACSVATAQAWGLNTRLCASAEPLLCAFDDAGIDTLALKGCALLGDVYEPYATRPMGDLDILIDRANVRRALRLANSLGWEGPAADGRWYCVGPPTHDLAGPRQGWIDLHQRPSRAFPHRRRFDRGIFATSEALPPSHPLAGSPLRRPNPAYQLVIVATHGTMAANAHIIHWMGDLHRIVTRLVPDPDEVARIAQENLVSIRSADAIDACARLLGTRFDTSALRDVPPSDEKLERSVTADSGQVLEAGSGRRAQVRRMWSTARSSTPRQGLFARIRVAGAYVATGRQIHRRR